MEATVGSIDLGEDEDGSKQKKSKLSEKISEVDKPPIDNTNVKLSTLGMQQVVEIDVDKKNKEIQQRIDVLEQQIAQEEG